jgi:branched-chain amino acid transport system ATP-binding protein
MRAPHPANPLLIVDGISVHFGGVHAIDEVSFTVADGDLLGLIGPNGAGKTTILRAIVGTVQPQSGDVSLSGLSLGGLTIDQRIRLGMALSQQLVKPLREISVIDNVALAAAYRKTLSPLKSLFYLSRDQELAVARQLLTRLGIADAADHYPTTLPLGVLKRLEMARALALDPKLLLLDEPLAGLNSQEADALASTITDINGQGVTIVLIEHNLREVLRICKRLVVLDNGRKIADGTPKEVMDLATVRAAYLGTGTAGKSAQVDQPSAPEDDDNA